MRCIKVVHMLLQQLQINQAVVGLGSITFTGTPSSDQMEKLRKALLLEGFEVLEDAKVQLVEQVKTLIIHLVQHDELADLKQNLSHYLAAELHKDYSYLSSLFSSFENITIEQFFILQKIEKVKEWLVYNEASLGQMAFDLGYSSVAHLSNQFKKITGFTPSQFKKLKVHNRKPLDSVK